MNKKEIEKRLNMEITNSVPNVLENILSKCNEKERMSVMGVENNVKKNNKLIPRLAGVLAVALVAVFGVVGVNNYNVSQAREKLIDSAIKAEIKDVRGNNIQKEQLSQLSVDDLGTLLTSKQVKIEDTKVKSRINNSAYIGEEKAKQIAFNDASVNANNVNLLKVEIDYDDGRLVYEVDFYSNNTEYDYEIDAKTGEILERDIEKERNINTNSNTSASTNTDINTNNITSTKNTTNSASISRERAKEIAFKNANVSSSSVRELTVELDYERGKAVYEVDFKSGNMEYDYEIDATTGSIIKVDKEYDD